MNDMNLAERAVQATEAKMTVRGVDVAYGPRIHGQTRVSQKTAFFERSHLVEFGDTTQIATNPRDPRTENDITGRIG